MEAAGSPSKRRKTPGLDPPEAANPAAAAAEERGPEPEPAAEDQEPPLAGADGGAAKDRISLLPDAVLQDIISLHPTKEGARTTLLAEVRPSPPPAKEMEAAGSPSKKRKTPEVDPPEAANPATAAAEERGAESAAEDQEPPLPAAAGGAAKDRISHLPEAVLQDIISLLPTKEGARTPLLASGWRKLWRSAPLNIDHHFWRSATLDLDHLLRCRDGTNLADVVTSILSAHTGPCRHFCAPVYHLHGRRATTADAWLRSPALRNLQELELRSYQPGLPYQFTVPRPSPAAAFRFSETLCVAIIGNCQFPDITGQAIRFPKLKKLALEHVSISESSLNTMIAGCLALECLLIAHSEGFHCVRINSISLRSICVKRCPEKLIIENAPCLERLLHQTKYQSHTSVISAPKLETIGCLSADSSTRLVLGSTVIQGLYVDTLMPEVRTVKILSVHMGVLSLDATINLMRCFPCLERLYLKCDGPGETNGWVRKRRLFLESFDIRLKKISWHNYQATKFCFKTNPAIKSHVNFATFFVLNARVLELMTFQVHSEDCNEEYFAQQHRMLKLDRKVSRGAQFRFTPDDSHRCVEDFGIHDLDLADPFERKDPYKFHDLS